MTKDLETGLACFAATHGRSQPSIRASLITAHFDFARRRPRPNSPQKLARPGFGPPAEPAREVKTAGRHAARIRAPHMQRAACRSGFGTWALAVQLSV